MQVFDIDVDVKEMDIPRYLTYLYSLPVIDKTKPSLLAKGY